MTEKHELPKAVIRLYRMYETSSASPCDFSRTRQWQNVAYPSPCLAPKSIIIGREAVSALFQLCGISVEQQSGHKKKGVIAKENGVLSDTRFH